MIQVGQQHAAADGQVTRSQHGYQSTPQTATGQRQANGRASQERMKQVNNRVNGQVENTGIQETPAEDGQMGEDDAETPLKDKVRGLFYHLTITIRNSTSRASAANIMEKLTPKNSIQLDMNKSQTWNITNGNAYRTVLPSRGSEKTGRQLSADGAKQKDVPQSEELGTRKMGVTAPKLSTFHVSNPGERIREIVGNLSKTMNLLQTNGNKPTVAATRSPRQAPSEATRSWAPVQIQPMPYRAGWRNDNRRAATSKDARAQQLPVGAGRAATIIDNDHTSNVLDETFRPGDTSSQIDSGDYEEIDDSLLVSQSVTGDSSTLDDFGEDEESRLSDFDESVLGRTQQLPVRAGRGATTSNRNQMSTDLDESFDLGEYEEIDDSLLVSQSVTGDSSTLGDYDEADRSHLSDFDESVLGRTQQLRLGGTSSQTSSVQYEEFNDSTAVSQSATGEDEESRLSDFDESVLGRTQQLRVGGTSSQTSSVQYEEFHDSAAVSQSANGEDEESRFSGIYENLCRDDCYGRDPEHRGGQGRQHYTLGK